MSKDERSSVNPFTGKQHFDIINDDKFLEKSYNEYYSMINKSQLLDTTSQGQLVRKVAVNLIDAVESYLSSINRSDYTEDYYDWDVHLVNDSTVNAFCMPGGKIVLFSGILSVADSEEKIAFILGHEMAHALLDHSRTMASARSAQNAITSTAWFGSLALDLIGLGEAGSLTRAVTNVASVGSQFFLMNPWGRDQELEADKLGMMIIHWAGYDVSHVPDFWQSMFSLNSNEHDFFSTYPADSKRIAVMSDLVFELNNQSSLSSVKVLSCEDYRSNVKYCPNCGNEESSDANFCTNCGNRLDLRCVRCGCEFDAGDLYCANCGCKLVD